MISTNNKSRVIQKFADPVKFCKIFWPHFTFYDKQREIMYSVRDHYETIVPAAHEVGKDFVSAAIVVWFFCSRRPCMIMTTGPTFGQLENVLWGEIRRFIHEAKYPLPLRMNRTSMFQVRDDGTDEPQSFVDAKVVQKGESMMGMHVARTPWNEPTTLLVCDEASGCEDEPYHRADSWTHRKLVIGNPYPCTNYFLQGTKEGRLESKRRQSGMENLYRNVIQIKAIDSPNVRLGLAQEKTGQVTHEQIVPGVLSYADYLQRRESWDAVKQCIGLDAEFYEGEEVLLYPPIWLDKAEQLAAELEGKKRRALAIGVDPAEGGDSTCWCAVDEYGVIELVAKKTKDTSVIPSFTLAFMRRHGMDPKDMDQCQQVCFDRGGGGKEHADRLRADGYYVRTVAFGAPATDEEAAFVPGMKLKDEKVEIKEQAYVYRNKRAELAGRVRLRLKYGKLGIPRSKQPDDPYSKLRKQMAVIPLQYDKEGRMMLPPKNKINKDSKEVTLVELIGHSPDEFDSLGIAVYAMEVESGEAVAGVF